jgi:hypothetical protein
MTAIRIENFAGIAPRLSDRLLPPNAAVDADNVKLTAGELRGLRQPKNAKSLTTVGFTVRRAFRIPNSLATPTPMDVADLWVPFADVDVDFVRSPLTSDSFERYYWTSDSSLYSGVPKYNTRARIASASAPYRLGVPTPTTAPTVTPPAGTDKTRAYVYTFVSAYGEESAPSPPTLATGANGSWALTAMDTTVPNSSERNITDKKIYRTVPGLSSSEFFYVGTVALATASYNDVTTDADAADNPILESTSFTPPPDTLKGIVAHPNGFLVGFTGRDLWFSEPFRPHAWPVAYVLTTETEIVGTAIYNGSVVVATNSRPYTVDGVHPANMSLQKIDSIDPCISRRSIVTTLSGVFYASPQGIVAVSPGVSRLITSGLITRQEWYDRYNPPGIKAVGYGTQYIAFDRTDSGFIISPTEPLALLTETEGFINVEGIQIDQYTGEAYLVQSNLVNVWDPVSTAPLSYTWKSKVFELPKPVNFGALQVKFRNALLEIGADVITGYQNFNNARITDPLNCVNLAAVNSVREETISGWVEPQNKTPVGGSPLYELSELLSITPAVQVRIWARMPNSVMENVYTQTLEDELPYKLPPGFKSDVWQIEIISNTDVYSVAIAETAKELVVT